MNEALEIRNFGPLNQVKIDLKSITVLIGGQGTGKSTICKLVNILKDIQFIVGDNKEKNRIISENYLSNYFKDNTFIKFNSVFYSVTFKNKKFSVSYKQPLNQLTKDIKKFYTANTVKNHEMSFFQNLSQKYHKHKGVAVYIPTERSIISLIKDASFSFFDNKITFPKYILDFGNEFARANHIEESLAVDFLEFSYKFDGTKGRILKDNKLFELHEIASGYQNLIPLLLVYNFLTKEDTLPGLFLIEEPETNLFPKTQHELIKHLITRCLKINDRILFTTHSPYTLSSLNNLMFAYQVGEINERKTSKIIAKRFWVNPSSVSAYMLNENGTVDDIIDYDVKQIKAEKIDAISRVLNEEYDALLDIKYSKK